MSKLRSRSNKQHYAHMEAVRYANRYGWHCHWCGITLDAKTITADHLIPMSQGGSSHEPNIVPACKECNGKRGTKEAYR